ncbi:gastrula zinc finger protein XlCGF49.1 isoform X1 [Labeo rohita]|nr:gastrula zinc finger protein XlCGF49.1 isoform X1 [Labeo rohita]
MAFVKVESEGLRIEKVFSLKCEDTEEQTDTMAVKEENQEVKIEENSTETGNTSSGNGAQECLEPYICGQCGKSFRCKKHIYQHMRIHSKMIICIQCKTTFPDKKQLKEHVKSHITKRKPFMCLYCGRNCKRKERLSVHLRVHTREKPFTCEHCGKRFAQRSSINVHLRIHTGERPFVCLQCGKGFAQRATLSDHMRVHTGEKPFSCTLCGKKFAKKQNVKVHMSLHTGERPYKCLWCEESYIYRNLRDHLQTHSRKRPLV